MKASVYKGPAASFISVTPDGGVNLGERAHSIKDGQASDIMNMWYRDGALRLRPGILKKLEQEYGGVIDVYPKDGRRYLLKRVTVDGNVTEEKYGVYIAARKAVLAFDGVSLERIPSGATYSLGGWTPAYTDYTLDSCIMMPGKYVSMERTDSDGVVHKIEGGMAYLFGSGYYLTIMPEMFVWPYPFGQIHLGVNVTISARQAYIPCICRSTLPGGSGEAYETRNFLTPEVRQTFTADSVSTVYRLYDTDIDDAEVTVNYLDPTTNTNTGITISAGKTSQSASNLTVTLDRSAGTLTFSSAPKGVSGLKDNVSVVYSKTVYPDVPITRCRFGQWYGDFDSKNGGGSRIFLSGDGSNLVYYSAANKPDYFPDDCIVTVGDGDDMVTGFGEQFGVLVVLKRHSVYAIDTSGSSFSLRQVHIGDGCDMPGSIQSTQNLLIFASSVSGIFMLRSTQIKNERTVVHISRHVDASLLALPRETLTEACSVSAGGYYFLFTGTSVYCIDCSEERLTGSDAADKLAFYIWELPITPAAAFLFGGTVYVVSGADDAFYAFDTSAASDGGKWFAARWHSKEFDSGSPGRMLKLRPLTLDMCNTDQVEVLAGFAGTDALETVRLDASGKGERHSRMLVGAPEGIADTVAAAVERAPGSLAAYGIDSVTFRLEKAAAAGTFVR